MTRKTGYPSRFDSPLVRSLLIALFIVAGSGCNLTLDLQDYPYEGPVDASADTTDSVDDTDPTDTGELDTSDTTLDASDAFDIPDVDPEDRPTLIFTEIMPDSSVEGSGSVEYGEFIEVKNVGSVAADPRRIVIELEDANRRIAIDPFPADEREQEVLDALQPIEPGDYFVFVRQDSDYYRITADLEAGTFYEYGRWNEQIPLSNTERTLTMFYRFSEFEAFVTDKIEWVSGSLIDSSLQTATTRELREDVSLGVQEISESQEENDSPANWCYHTNQIEGSPVKASPGGPTPATCTVE